MGWMLTGAAQILAYLGRTSNPQTLRLKRVASIGFCSLKIPLDT